MGWAAPPARCAALRCTALQCAALLAALCNLSPSTVTSPGVSCSCFLQGCWFLLSPTGGGSSGGGAGRQLADARDLQEGRVGTCIVGLAGEAVDSEAAFWSGEQYRGWALHFLVSHYLFLFRPPTGMPVCSLRAPALLHAALPICAAP